MAWSQESRRLLIWNLDDSVDVYESCEDNHLRYLHMFRVPALWNFIKLVDFVEHGDKTICGTDGGEIDIWDIESGIIVQRLTMGSCA